ncbi:protease inhibitor I42 family protein [Patescibacteria group bacterium]|nr:protease inhibitor I42 family protein [Patescibacteria group bacterium]
MLFIVIILLASAIFIAIDFICWPEKTVSPTSSENYIFTEANEGAVQVSVGHEFVVLLETNPTTGFQWGLQLDPNYIDFKGKEYIADESAEEIVGAGGHEKFTFTAMTIGQSEIIFAYTRPWESIEPKKVITYSIVAVE